MRVYQYRYSSAPLFLCGLHDVGLRKRASMERRRAMPRMTIKGSKEFSIRSFRGYCTWSLRPLRSQTPMLNAAAELPMPVLFP